MGRGAGGFDRWPNELCRFLLAVISCPRHVHRRRGHPLERARPAPVTRRADVAAPTLLGGQYKERRQAQGRRPTGRPSSPLPDVDGVGDLPRLLSWLFCCVLRRVRRPDVRVLGDHHEVITGSLAQRCSELSLCHVAVRHGKPLGPAVALQNEDLVNRHQIHLYVCRRGRGGDTAQVGSAVSRGTTQF